MATREEMLRGIIMVNNERQDSKATAKSSEASVRDDDSVRHNEPAGERGAHGAPASPAVSGSEGSLEEILVDREEFCAEEVARLNELIDSYVDTRNKLKHDLKVVRQSLVLLRGESNEQSSSSADGTE